MRLCGPVPSLDKLVVPFSELVRKSQSAANLGDQLIEEADRSDMAQAARAALAADPLEMFKCVIQDDVRKLAAVLDAGVDIDFRNNAGLTALDLATQREKEKTKAYLITRIAERDMQRERQAQLDAAAESQLEGSLVADTTGPGFRDHSDTASAVTGISEFSMRDEHMGKLELMRRQQNDELLQLLEAEHTKEKERELILSVIPDDGEHAGDRGRIERMFSLDRAKAQQKIKRLSRSHGKALKSTAAALALSGEA